MDNDKNGNAANRWNVLSVPVAILEIAAFSIGMAVAAYDIAGHALSVTGLDRSCFGIFFSISLAAVSSFAWWFSAPESRLFGKDAVKGVSSRPTEHTLMLMASYITLVVALASAAAGAIVMIVGFFK